MADEIEEYMMNKLTEALTEADGAEQHWADKSAVQQVKKLSREKLYNLNNLLTELQMQPKKQTRCYPFESLINKVKFARNLDKIKGALQSADGITASNGETTQPASQEAIRATSEIETFRWSTRSVDETKVYGLDDKVKSLQRMLIQDKDDDTPFKAIGIVGMRGVGKTTLCQLIFNSGDVKTHFVPRIWVCLSKQTTSNDKDYRKEALKRILDCLGVEEEIINSVYDRHSLKGLLLALRLQLVGKRYLIVLDDVWRTEEDEYRNFCYSLADDDEKYSERLAFGLPKGFGGTVIVTSRAEEVTKRTVGEENLHRLLPLSDQESCWEIFKDSVDSYDQQFSKLLETSKLKDEIIDKCAGIPVAAKVMGQIVHQYLLESRQEQSPQELKQPTN